MSFSFAHYMTTVTVIGVQKFLPLVYHTVCQLTLRSKLTSRVANLQLVAVNPRSSNCASNNATLTPS